MKSFCIKTNNKKIQDYLLENFLESKLDLLYVSQNSFSKYENIIIHYKGNIQNHFYNTVSEIITSCISNFFENNLLKTLINYDYFYFSALEKKQILNIASSLLDLEKEYYFRTDLIFNAVKKYIQEEKSMILTGFVNFRLFEYIKVLDKVVDTSVNQYLIQKEYLEFINLLKVYISSTPSKTNSVHFVYNKYHNYLLNENYEIIPINEEFRNTKYVSDISFSKNDYILNTLLTILPKELIIHFTSSNQEDEFINTLKLIFDKRISICTDCNLCEMYKLNKNLFTKN